METGARSPSSSSALSVARFDLFAGMIILADESLVRASSRRGDPGRDGGFEETMEARSCRGIFNSAALLGGD